MKITAAAFLRAVLRQDASNTDGAVADFSKVIEINPQHAEPYADRGLARLGQVLDSEAQKDFDKYLELTSGMKS